MVYPPKPKVAISSLVNSLKGVSSRLLRKKDYPSIKQQLWGDALWSPSYFAGSCGGAPVEIIRQYIEQQNTPHEIPSVCKYSYGVALYPPPKVGGFTATDDKLDD